MKGLIIQKPVISEKSVYLGNANKYIFKVDPRANMATIKLAVENIFKVKVKSINIMRVKGKPKQFGRMKVKRKDEKKAIITLQPGQTIKLFEEKVKDAS